jgi:hypothetical protein
LLFNVVFRIPYLNDTAAAVTVYMDNIIVYDSLGHNTFPYSVKNGYVNAPRDDRSVRGDANCSGALLGADVTYLINYFRGLVDRPCSLRAGDANAGGSITGADVTYLVNYFMRDGPPPPP